MKKLNKYLVYIDNGGQTTSAALPATSKKAVVKSLDGCGEIVAVKNLTDEHIIKADDIRDALQASGKFDALETAWIVRTLTMTGMATDGTEPEPDPQPDSTMTDTTTDAAADTAEPTTETRPRTRRRRTNTRTDTNPTAEQETPEETA